MMTSSNFEIEDPRESKVLTQQEVDDAITANDFPHNNRGQRRMSCVRATFILVVAMSVLIIFAFRNVAFTSSSSSKQMDMSSPSSDSDGGEEGSRIFVFEIDGLQNGESSTRNGHIKIRTRPSWAPRGVEHFHQLMDEHFYIGCKFFRVVPNFIVQFGLPADPKTNNEDFIKTPIMDDPVIQTNSRGTVTYATSGPNTRTTQLFINTRADKVMDNLNDEPFVGGNAQLDKQGFSPFAEVIEGMEIVDQIYSKYGEQPDQGRIREDGNEYLDDKFPLLSYIKDIQSL